jgi:N-acetylglutamate synthase-like GNAT family acetyltransferase
MIRKAKPEDAEEIIKLVSRILPSSVLVQIDKSTLESNLRNETQVSYVYDAEGIQAHASLYSESNVSILGNFAVSSSLRHLGIARLLMKLLEDKGKKIDMTHLSAYALLQHEYSQRLFDNSYIPVGVSLSSVRALNYNDSLFDGRMLNGEICLCKPLGKNHEIVVPGLSGFETRIKDLYKSINVRVGVDKKLKQPISPIDDYVVVDIREESASSLIRSAHERNYVCLGIFPSGRDGLNMLGFASKKFVNKLSQNYVTNNNERDEFVRTTLLG